MTVFAWIFTILSLSLSLSLQMTEWLNEWICFIVSRCFCFCKHDIVCNRLHLSLWYSSMNYGLPCLFICLNGYLNQLPLFIPGASQISDQNFRRLIIRFVFIDGPSPWAVARFAERTWESRRVATFRFCNFCPFDTSSFVTLSVLHLATVLPLYLLYSSIICSWSKILYSIH